MLGFKQILKNWTFSGYQGLQRNRKTLVPDLCGLYRNISSYNTRFCQNFWCIKRMNEIADNLGIKEA